MHRFKILLLLVLLSVVAAAASLAYFRADRGPTTEEFRVYSAFLKHLAAETQQQNEFSVASKTLELADPQYDSWIPVELRSDRTRPSSDLVTFCGLCGRDFVRKKSLVLRAPKSYLAKAR